MRGHLFSEDIRYAFESLDSLLEEKMLKCDAISDEKTELIVAGSTMLIYNSWIPYGTEDIDYISCSSSWLAQQLEEYGLNNRIQAFGDSWAYNYEDRLVPIYEGKFLRVLSLCLEDLIFMKLSRWSDYDIEDISALINSEIEIDMSLLDHLVHDEEESRGAGMSDRTYGNLLFAYDDFCKRFGSSIISEEFANV